MNPSRSPSPNPKALLLDGLRREIQALLEVSRWTDALEPLADGIDLAPAAEREQWVAIYVFALSRSGSVDDIRAGLALHQAVPSALWAGRLVLHHHEDPDLVGTVDGQDTGRARHALAAQALRSELAADLARGALCLDALHSVAIECTRLAWADLATRAFLAWLALAPGVFEDVGQRVAHNELAQSLLALLIAQDRQQDIDALLQALGALEGELIASLVLRFRVLTGRLPASAAQDCDDKVLAFLATLPSGASIEQR